MSSVWWYYLFGLLTGFILFNRWARHKFIYAIVWILGKLELLLSRTDDKNNDDN